MKPKKDPLESIIGDPVRAALLRVFSSDKDAVYAVKEFARTLRKKDTVIRAAIREMEKDGIVLKKKIPTAKRKESNLKEVYGYGFNKRYMHRDFLDAVVKQSMPDERDVLARKLSKVPGVQCVITTDIFLDTAPGDMNILIASSDDNEVLLRHSIQEMERRIGKELRCAFLTVNDFMHRIRTNDRFIRDFLDREHRVHVDRAGLFPE